MFQSLIYILEGLIEAHKRLIAHAEDKKEMLIKGDVERLSKALAEESKLARQLSKLEQERDSATQELIVKHDLTSSGHIALSDVLAAFPDSDEKERVKELATTLQEQVTKLKNIYEINGRLIQDALNFVNDSMETLTDNSNPMNYSKPSSNHPHDNATKRSFFDFKA